MDRVYKSGGTAAVPSAADNASGPNPRSGDPGAGLAATKPGPYWFYMITEEIAKAIEGAGIAPDKTVLTQLRDAIALLYDNQGVDPGGRLTLESGVGVSSADQAAKTTVYYTPHRHNRIRLYDGTRWKWYTFAELSQATTDNTKSPAAVAASKNYDVFAWDDGGTLRATRGPTWDAGAVAGSDTARGTGAGSTELEFFEGRWVNKNAITNGPAARRGLFVGTIRSDASSQINDTLAIRHVWNAVNRVRRPMFRHDSTDSWTYDTDAFREANGSTANRLSFVAGLAGEAVNATVVVTPRANVTSATWIVGIGVNSTTVNSAINGGATGTAASNRPAMTSATYVGPSTLGAAFLSWLERTTATGGGTVTWMGDEGGTAYRSGITGEVSA